MQSSISSSGVNNRNLTPSRPIAIVSLFKICVLLIFSTLRIQGMRVHPLSLKQDIALREEIDSNFSLMEGNFAVKKLRKLPHVFNNVLELPFRSDADVTVEETEGFFCFVAEIYLEGAGNGRVRAQAVEIHPGVTKIVVRKGNGDGEMELLLEQLNVDTWRYRLPASTMPELATAAFVDGALVVTVPKGGREGAEFEDGSRGVWGGGGPLVLVQ
ncbi:PREDICTED: uncharacterized protein LOC109232966 [Nicotiana attenuata]|uniref:SHSP domain-containing protein n=1 Tax=Nicotiana attenuata TaxID=49451 RepID=A0A1J6HXH3_NICAT|nr:PREDICTED: uncharacterized protein LOC109232966 [Nicotiana attenuata]OIS97533.1 hypothetical protein A4A49_16162 [Nicotiana attenuata]